MTAGGAAVDMQPPPDWQNETDASEVMAVAQERTAAAAAGTVMAPPLSEDPAERAATLDHPAGPPAGEVRPPPADMELGEPAVAVDRTGGAPRSVG